MEIKLAKSKAPKGGKHKALRSMHNKDKGKYVRQGVRTAANKLRHIKKAKALKAVADLRREEKENASTSAGTKTQ